MATNNVFRIFIDAGHGGSDPGAVKYEIERDLNIKVAQYLNQYLEATYVCETYLDITDDSTHVISARANKWRADLFISIHFNASGGDGFECFLHSSANINLGKCFEKHVKAIGQNSRGVKYDKTLNVLRITNMPAVLNEIAFVDNKKDIEDWNDASELKKMGTALAKAGAEYGKLKKKSVAPPKPVKPSTIKVGAKVKVESGAKDLNTKKQYSDFVYKTTYTVISIIGDRVVFGLNGKVTGATEKSNLSVVGATPTKILKVGAKVKVKAGAKDLNTKTAYSEFVYKTTYTVIEIKGNRVVFGLNGQVTGATSKSNIKII